LAPAATTMVFCPSALTVINATPLAACASCCTKRVSTPSACNVASSVSPNLSVPTRPIMRTGAPRRAAATDWLAPLPPGKV